MADSSALIYAMKELTTALRTHAGGPVAGGSPLIAGPSGMPAGGKNMAEILDALNTNIEKLTDVTGKSTKATSDNKDALTSHLKSLEVLGSVLSLAGPMLNQYAKYAVSRPFEMLGGTQAAVGGRMMERERDTGQIVTTALAAMALAVPGIGMLLSGGIVGLGAAGGNAMLGRGLFQPQAVRAAGEETAARMATERVMQARDSMYLNYRLGRLDVAGRGMRGMGGNAGADVLAEMGLTGNEAADVMTRVQAAGARGYSRFDMGRARAITEMGVYGQDIGANAQALQIGNRTGFSEAELLRGARRTGFQLPEMAQAAQAARQQTFMMGMGAGNQLFNAATNTTMGQILGPGAAMAGISQAAGATAAASAGDEAASMLLFRQFVDANPGSTYLDFLEARSMKESSPKWRKMMAQASGAYGGNQMMRIAGVGLGIFRGAGREAVSTSQTLLRQAAGMGGAGEIMGEAGGAPGSEAFRRLGKSDLEQSRAAAGQMEREFGGTIVRVTNGLTDVAKSAKTMSDATINSAKVMEKSVVSSANILDRAITDFAKKHGVDIYRDDTNTQEKK
jgi:hypothetical protein